MFKKSPPKLPPLVMIPRDGEYHIMSLPKKQTWLQRLLQDAIIWIALFLIGGFCSYVISVTNARLP